MMRALVAILVLFALLPALGKGERGPRVSLNYNRADLGYVCKQLGKSMGCNVYVSQEVEGSVTLTVRDVNAEGALAMVLKLQPVRYDYKLVGNTLVVATPEKLATIPVDLFQRR